MGLGLAGTGMKDFLWDLRGEGDFVECARCGKAITFEEAEPEEGRRVGMPPV